MRLAVQNIADVPKKHVRYIKWRLYNLQRLFDYLEYAYVFISAEGKKPRLFTIKFRLGIPGNDLIIKKSSSNLSTLCTQVCKEARSQLGAFK